MQASATATFIATDSLFVGNIRGRGQFVVFGEVQGDGDLEGGLNLSATGRWIGTIRAHVAIVAGELVVTSGKAIIEFEEKRESR